MRRRSLSILFGPLLSFAFLWLVTGGTGIVRVVKAQTDLSDKPAIRSVSLDKPFVEKWCPVSKSPMSMCPFGGDRVHVTTVVESKHNVPVLYLYKVSGGQIIGHGSHVVWDLANAAPGLHSITVSAVSSSRQKAKKLTETIELRECSVCDPPCFCPILSVTSSKDVLNPGEPVVIAADTGEQFNGRVKYRWTINGGKINGGAKGKSIKVRTADLSPDAKLTATVEIFGTDPHCNCLTTASVEIAIVPGPDSGPE